jgi:hypothetical protein
MKLIKIIMFAIIIGITISFSQVWGITYGEPDGDGHPFVAAVVGINTADGGAVRGRCSGALIQLLDNRSAILTAGHCAYFWFAVGNDAVGITFEPEIGDNPDTDSLDPSRYPIIGGTVVLHPDYGPPGSWNPQNDLAIVVFNEDETDDILDEWGAISGFDAASLIPLNYLSNLKKKDLKALEVKNVGYGIIERLNFPGSNAGGVMPAQGYGVRRVSFPSSVLSIDQTRVHMSQNPAREDEGTCNGDSGSPNYINYQGDPNVILSVTSSGDSFCRATNIGARVDTPQAVDFIECVLESPDDLEDCGIVEIWN